MEYLVCMAAECNKLATHRLEMMPDEGSAKNTTFRCDLHITPFIVVKSGHGPIRVDRL